MCTAPHPAAVFTLCPVTPASAFLSSCFQTQLNLLCSLRKSPRLLLHFLVNIPSSTWLLKPENSGGPGLFPLPHSPRSSGPPILSSEFVFTMASLTLTLTLLTAWRLTLDPNRLCLHLLVITLPPVPTLMSVIKLKCVFLGRICRRF